MLKVTMHWYWFHRPAMRSTRMSPLSTWKEESSSAQYSFSAANAASNCSSVLNWSSSA